MIVGTRVCRRHEEVAGYLYSISDNNRIRVHASHARIRRPHSHAGLPHVEVATDIHRSYDNPLRVDALYERRRRSKVRWRCSQQLDNF